MTENTSISENSNPIPTSRNSNISIIFIALIIIGAIVAGVVVAVSSSNNSNSGSSISTTLPLTNKFSNTLQGDTGGFRNNFNFIEDVKTATDNISDILNDDKIIPLKFIVSNQGKDDIIASATKIVDNNLYAGGIIYIYSNFSYNLSTTYVEVLMHEILHLMGIGLHSKWANACNNNKLDGNQFPNALTEYNKLTGGNHTDIPIGNYHGHWKKINLVTK